MNKQFLRNFFGKLKTAAKSFKTIAVVFLIIILICYAIYAFFRFSYINNRDTAMDKINSTVLTLADVMGENLPKTPDQAVNDSTIAGIDANNNMVRDDVELAIFEKYPNSAKMRSALLQYAQALQLELTVVNSEEVMHDYLEKWGASYLCFLDAIDYYRDSEDNSEGYQFTKKINDEIDAIIINTQSRKDYREYIYKRFMTSSGDSGKECDVELMNLPN
jgi:hypothetical protein